VRTASLVLLNAYVRRLVVLVARFDERTTDERVLIVARVQLRRHRPSLASG